MHLTLSWWEQKTNDSFLHFLCALSFHFYEWAALMGRLPWWWERVSICWRVGWLKVCCFLSLPFLATSQPLEESNWHSRKQKIFSNLGNACELVNFQFSEAPSLGTIWICLWTLRLLQLRGPHVHLCRKKNKQTEWNNHIIITLNINPILPKDSVT